VTPSFFRDDPCPGAEQVLLELAHDIRQPLSAIEAITYYLQMKLPGELLEAHGLLARVQKLLETADEVLVKAESTQTRVQLRV